MSQSHHCHNLRVRPIFQGISAQGEQGGQVGSKPLQANDSGTKWNWVCKTTIHNFYQPPKIVTRPDWSLDCRLQIYTTQTFWNSVALSLGQVLWIYIQNFTSPFMPYAHMPIWHANAQKDHLTRTYAQVLLSTCQGNLSLVFRKRAIKLV